MYEIIAIVLMLGGFVVGLGTAGASDTEIISESQMYIQTIVAIVMMVVGLCMIRFRKEEEE